ncbi:MAG: type 4a pilus biogenesis protein PilO [Deltaproteobacteria bacterium]|nr:type 4a pilus biogenesis protein PilO [Deltaproteobacteria bacterium]
MDLKTVAKPREQILSLGVTVGILVVFLQAVYAPHRSAQAQMAVKIHNLELEKEALEKFTQALVKQTSKTKAKEPTAQLKILQGELSPFAEATSILLSQMTAPQFLRGVEVKKMSDLPPDKKNGFSVSHFTLLAEGPFLHVFYFLERVEKFPALVTIDNITLKALDSKASRVDLEVNGSLYQMGENSKG